MAPSIISTSIKRNAFAKNARYNYMLWSVTVQDFDGEEMEFEVTANDENEASAEATRLAADYGMYNVYNTFVTKF